MARLRIFVDEELEITHPFQECLEKFQKRGGTVHFLPGEVDLQDGDFLYTACSGAQCRSQALHLFLQQKITTTMRLHLPHASRRGYDPYNGLMHIHRERKIEDQFEQYFGRSKAERFGYDQVHKWICGEGWDIPTIREYYDREYFGPSSAKRRLYFAFAKPVHVIIKRLIDANDDLSRVHVIAIPLEDEITSPPEGLTGGSCEAYQRFMKLLEGMVRI